MKCSGPCDKGRLSCPTPMLCELPEHQEYPESDRSLSSLFLAVVLVALTIALVGIAAGYCSAR